MADEKLNVSPEENPQPSLFDTGPADAPAPETSAPEPPAPENIPGHAERHVRWCERGIKFPLLDFKRILGEAWRR